MRCLVIEDDPVIAGHIVGGLSAAGIATTWAANATQGLAQGCDGDFDSVVLDRLLPDGNGIDLIKAWKRHGPVPPVLMLSALGSVKDRIEGLEAGADDYLAKPFHMAELVARVHAIARRVPERVPERGPERVPEHVSERGQDRIAAQGPNDHAVPVIGRLQLDPSRHLAVFGDATVELNRKLYSLLAHLMLHADRLVTRDMLLEQVWGYSFSPGTNIVESNMSRLRTRLQELGIDPILTRRGEGYMLLAGACR